MLDNTRADSHRHDLHDRSTSGQCHQATPARHEATISSSTGTNAASILHTGAIALPVGTLFGGDYTSALNSIPGLNMQYNHGPAPTDGELVWFCSDCSDGPFASWQTFCPICSHQKCSSCIEEDTG